MCIRDRRYTDQQTMDIVQMVLSGKVNKDLVSLLGECGGKAIGMCGMDGMMMRAEKIQSDVDLGLVGEIVDVDTEPDVYKRQAL